MREIRNDEVKRILALSDAFGPSGLEDEVSALVRKELEGTLDLTEDRMRNVRGVLNPEVKGPRIMLDAHLDEVGAVVQAVKPNGTMRFLTLGGWTASHLPSSLFHIRNREGKLVKANVAAKPVHFASAAERNAPLSVDDMVLDCGSTSAEETVNGFGIGIGSFAAPAVTASYDEEKRLFFGKAFDCRIGVAAQIETLKQLKEKGYRMAVATSTRMVYTRPHLIQAGILEYFPVIVTGEMVEHGKPAPDIFLLAAERLGSKPEECVVVGDTPADVFAGFDAGMDVYLIPDQVPANQETVARSRRVLEHLGQLPEALEELECIKN